MPHTIKVGLYNNTPFVEPNSCTVCLDCEVEWVAAAGVSAFDVQFAKKGEPFSNDKFNKSSSKSGRPVKQTAPGKKDHYKYTITVNGQYVLDPEVVVDGGP